MSQRLVLSADLRRIAGREPSRLYRASGDAVCRGYPPLPDACAQVRWRSEASRSQLSESGGCARCLASAGRGTGEVAEMAAHTGGGRTDDADALGHGVLVRASGGSLHLCSRVEGGGGEEDEREGWAQAGLARARQRRDPAHRVHRGLPPCPSSSTARYADALGTVNHLVTRPSRLSTTVPSPLSTADLPPLRQATRRTRLCTSIAHRVYSLRCQTCGGECARSSRRRHARPPFPASARPPRAR